MAGNALNSVKKEIVWTPTLIKRVRGKRTQAKFAKLLGVPKNTVWRWEARRVSPDAEHAQRLSQLAADERFLAGWKVAGSLKFIGDFDLEEASRQLKEDILESLARSARQL